MEVFREWMLGIVLTGFAIGLAEQIVPNGREQSAVKFVGGLIMILALLRPLGEISWDQDVLSTGGFADAIQLQSETYKEQQQKELCAIIEERLETYIWDKATEQGFECRVTVYAAVQESGIPLPDSVVISIPRDPSLAVWLEEVVGIPADKQIWQEESAWTTEKG